MTWEIGTYNLRIVPPDPIYSEVVRFKRLFEKLFERQRYTRSNPHITLSHFEMNTEYEHHLIATFSQLSNTKKFQLDLNGVGTFESSKTLYINVSPSKAIDQLNLHIKQLWQYQLRRKAQDLKGMGKPHITISKAVGNAMLLESLDFFKKFGYQNNFTTNRLTLCKYQAGKGWKNISSIDLRETV